MAFDKGEYAGNHAETPIYPPIALSPPESRYKSSTIGHHPVNIAPPLPHHSADVERAKHYPALTTVAIASIVYSKKGFASGLGFGLKVKMRVIRIGSEV